MKYTLHDLIQARGVSEPLREAVVALMAKLEAAEKERDALRAKVNEMERQEPVAEIGQQYTLLFAGSGSITGIVKRHGLKIGDKLYALPGAQPYLNEIKITLQRALELGQRETWTGARKHRSWEDQREEQQCWNRVWSLLGTQGEEK